VWRKAGGIGRIAVDTGAVDLHGLQEVPALPVRVDDQVGASLSKTGGDEVKGVGPGR